MPEKDMLLSGLEESFEEVEAALAASTAEALGDTVVATPDESILIAVDDLEIGDLIADLDTGQGDVIDLSALLEAVGGAPADAAEADEVVKLQDNGDNTTSVLVDTDGTGSGNDFVEVARLSGVHTTIDILFEDGGTPTEVS